MYPSSVARTNSAPAGLPPRPAQPPSTSHPSCPMAHNLLAYCNTPSPSRSLLAYSYCASTYARATWMAFNSFLSYAPVYDLFLSVFGEKDPSLRRFHEGDGERRLVFPDKDEHCLIVQLRELDCIPAALTKCLRASLSAAALPRHDILPTVRRRTVFPWYHYSSWPQGVAESSFWGFELFLLPLLGKCQETEDDHANDGGEGRSSKRQ